MVLRTAHNPMKPEARDLVLAVLTRIQEMDGTANKTKLLKLVYLADIEFFRTTGETFTGFDWIYFLYGPWTAEYDELLKQLEAEGVLTLEPWAGSGVEGERIIAKEKVPLESVIKSTDVFFRTRRHVDTWADRGVPRLLDYVYFETEPMQDAVKMQRLDFTKVSKEPPRLYRRTKSGADSSQLKAVRRRFSQTFEEASGQESWRSIEHQSAPFDEKYFRALAEFDKEE
ncbi:MAG TPA: hypothetical protein VN577_07855 [Terriglobales bacterium]|jgi:hypothetical protein|nr:hypothetical protein [Terriglobales bacterium]